jgi:hypothetical protein
MTMQSFYLENDLLLFGIQAESFPAGVQAAWRELHQKHTTISGRKFYGISHGTKEGAILYRACVEESYAGEAENFNCERFLLPKGEYVGETIHNFMQQLPKIGETFQTILARDDYDKTAACVEQYLNESDVVCMIKRKDKV